MPIENYILIGQTPVPATLLEWAEWFEVHENRIVKVSHLFDTVTISTVFLGLDHSFREEGPPILFETMVFWPGRDGYEQERCSTWLEAEKQHERMRREAARPAAVWAYCRRCIRDWWRDARADWHRGWRELRGIPPSEWEVLADRMIRARGECE